MTDPAMATRDPALHLDRPLIFDALFAETWGTETTWNDLERQPWWEVATHVPAHAQVDPARDVPELDLTQPDRWPNADTDMPTQELKAITEEEQ
jgi:hypothetical protein